MSAFSFVATCSIYGIERKQFRAGTATTVSTMNRQAQNFKKGISPFPLLTILPDPKVVAIRQCNSGWERWNQRLWQENWDIDFVRHCSSSDRSVWWSQKAIFMCLSLLISEIGVTILSCTPCFVCLITPESTWRALDRDTEMFLLTTLPAKTNREGLDLVMLQGCSPQAEDLSRPPFTLSLQYSEPSQKAPGFFYIAHRFLRM